DLRLAVQRAEVPGEPDVGQHQRRDQPVQRDGAARIGAAGAAPAERRGRAILGGGGHFFSNSASICRVTSSPTMLPRKVEPNAERFSVVVASKPAARRPNGTGSGSWADPMRVTSNVTGRVTPINVRSPVIVPAPGAPGWMAVETKVAFGNLPACRNSSAKVLE